MPGVTVRRGLVYTLVGTTTPQANTDEIPFNAKLVIRITPVVGVLNAVWIYADGNGVDGTTDEPVRAIVYSDTAGPLPLNLLASGSDVVVPRGSAFAWWRLPIVPGYVVPSTSPIWIGLHAGDGGSNSVQMKRAATGTAYANADNADTFSDGSNSTFGAGSAPSQPLYSMYAEIATHAPTPPLVVGQAMNVGALR